MLVPVIAMSEATKQSPCLHLVIRLLITASHEIFNQNGYKLYSTPVE